MVTRLHPLRRKLARDAWQLRGQLVAIALVVACGIASFVAMRSMHGHLVASRDAWYRAARFADVFTSVRRAPLREAAALAAIPGVAAVEARVAGEVVARVPGLVEPATLRLVSHPVPQGDALGAVHLVEGRWPTPGRDDEVIASRAFTRANALAIGDTIGVVLGGRWRRLVIAGVGLSAEYVYEIGAGAVFPDSRRYGVLWASRTLVAPGFDLDGAFNDVAVALAPGASEPAVIEAIDARLARYGTPGAHGREEQPSHRFVSGEIDETQVTSLLLPGIFLAVTAFLLHVVLGRLVAMQRDQLATLKAFGYRDRTIAAHYLGLAMIPIGAGTVLGITGGLALAQALAGVYARYFQFPTAGFTPDWGIVAVAALLGGGAGLTGALDAVRRGVALAPAAAMRPEAPARFGHGPIERMLARLVRSPRRMVVVRTLLRRPWRTASSIGGLALAGGLVIASRGVFDAIDFIKVRQFHVAERGDVTVLFREPRRLDAARELARLPGVLEVEAFRIVPVVVRHHAATYRTALVADADGATLRRVIGADGTVRRIPADGVVLAAALARRLDARVGDRVRVTLLDGARPVLDLPVSAVTDDLLGAAAYIAPATLARAVGGEPVMSGAALRTDARRADALYRRLEALPLVSGITVRRATLASFERTIAESFRISLLATLGFACIIAGGIVYNGARVALSERGRDLASLRILGFTRREVAGMLLGEQAVLVAASTPAAFAVAYALAWLITVRFESTVYRIPLVARPASYLVGTAVVVTAAVLSGLVVRRRLDAMDLVAVLKTRE